MIRDLTDDEARAASPLKWGMTEPGVIPAWVAEMDYAVAEPIVAALQDAIGRGELGYPRFDLGGGELGEAYAAFAGRHFGHDVDPGHVLATVDVTAGVRLALDVLSEDKSPMVLPLPAYSPQLGLAEVTNRAAVGPPGDPDGDEYVLDLDHLDRLFADGARTLLLTNPHNPCSHVHTRAELEGIRDLALKHGARVISDEIHAPLVLPGATHVPYLAPRGHGRARGRGRGRVQGVQHRRASSAPRWSPPTGRRSTGSPACRWRATTRGRRSAWWRRSRRTATATRGSRRWSSG